MSECLRISIRIKGIGLGIYDIVKDLGEGI